MSIFLAKSFVCFTNDDPIRVFFSLKFYDNYITNLWAPLQIWLGMDGTRARVNAQLVVEITKKQKTQTENPVFTAERCNKGVRRF